MTLFIADNVFARHTCPLEHVVGEGADGVEVSVGIVRVYLTFYIQSWYDYQETRRDRIVSKRYIARTTKTEQAMPICISTGLRNRFCVGTRIGFVAAGEMAEVN
jgi:hypothetical protein